MKISFISDLHLDFWVKWIPNQTKWEQRTREFVRKLIETDTIDREVICLGGDYSHYNSQTEWMLSEFSKAYNAVYMILGNHDRYLISESQVNKYKRMFDSLYHKKPSVARTMELKIIIQENFNNVFFLDDKVYEHKGIKFGGDTMWYPVNTIEQRVFYHDISNDSRLIYGRDPQDDNLLSLDRYYKMVDDIDVMVSHVPLIHIKSHSDYNSTACYYTSVGVLPDYVIQGHSHERAIYEKAGSKIFMNCLGYPHDNLGAPNIKSFTI